MRGHRTFQHAVPEQLSCPFACGAGRAMQVLSDLRNRMGRPEVDKFAEFFVGPMAAERGGPRSRR